MSRCSTLPENTHTPTHTHFQLYPLQLFFTLCVIVVQKNDISKMQRGGWKRSIFNRAAVKQEDTKMSPGTEKETHTHCHSHMHWMVISKLPSCCRLTARRPCALWQQWMCSHACVQMAVTSHPFQRGWGKWSGYSNDWRAHLSAPGPPACLDTRVQKLDLQKSLVMVNPSEPHSNSMWQYSFVQNWVFSVCKS